MTIQDLASTAYDSFERRTRDDGSVFYTLKDDAPAWVQPIVREAHGDMLPDDFVYKTCMDAFSWISGLDMEISDDHDEAHEFADGVQVYTADLLKWAASNLQRVAMCDEAVEEFGIAANDDGIARRLMLGQYQERYNIFVAVLSGLRETVLPEYLRSVSSSDTVA